MIVEIIESKRNGKLVRLYILEGEEHTRREETLLLVSES